MLYTANRRAVADAPCLVSLPTDPSQSNAPDCEKMFDTMGYGPLRKFFDDTELGVDGRAAFTKFGDDLKPQLTSCLQAASRAAAASGGDTMVVAGHAVFLNATALVVAVAAGMPAAVQEQLLDIDLGEAEGIELELTHERGAWTCGLKHVHV